MQRGDGRRVARARIGDAPDIYGKSDPVRFRRELPMVETPGFLIILRIPGATGERYISIYIPRGTQTGSHAQSSRDQWA